MSKAQAAPQMESYADAHPGDLAHQYVKGTVGLSEIPVDDYDQEELTKFRADLQVVLDHPEVGAGKVERAGKALHELPRPASE